MPTLTPNIKLQKPADAEFGWQNMLRQNSDTLDAEIAALKGVNQLTGTATGGSATTMVDASLTLGVDAFAGGGVVIIHRAGVLLRAEAIISNTATTLTFTSGTAPQAGDTYSIASQSGLAGAAAEVAAGRTNSVKRADGTWSVRARQLPQDYPLQAWADDLALGAYDINLSVSQNGLPAGWWYIEVMRHSGDANVNAQYRYLRATPLDAPLSAKPVYHCSVIANTWSAWTTTGADTSLSNLTVMGQDRVCTAWVNFAGTGTLNGSFNVLGVTNNGLGDYTVNFATNMVSTSYCVVATGVYPNTTWQQGVHVHTKSTTDVRVISTLVNATAFQPWGTDVSLVIFGGK